MKTFGIILISICVLWTLWGYVSSRVEQAEYSVIKKAKAYEIRNYPRHIVAQTTLDASDEDQALSRGFSIVAGYIFGRNRKKQGIAMTAPIMAQKSIGSSPSEVMAMTAPVIATKTGTSQTISFGMPHSYTLSTLPIPTDPRVRIVEVPSQTVAVLRFSGYRSKPRIRVMRKKLLAALENDGITITGEMSYAGYNAPWTPPWMIRNEVMVQVLQKTDNNTRGG